MPSAMRYVPPTESWRTQLTPEILQEKQRRHTEYTQALKYYKGDHVNQLLFDPETEPNDNVTINLIKTTADRTATFLFPEMPKWETDPEAIDPTEEEEYIEKFFEANGGLTTLVKIALRGFLSGHCFVRIRPARAWETYPRMLLLDPLSITVWWKADDVGDILWYEFRYAVGQSIYIQDFVADYENKRWLIYTYRSVQENEANPIPSGDTLLGAVGPHGAGYTTRLLSAMYSSDIAFKLVPASIAVDQGDGTFITIKRDYALHGSIIPPIIEWPHLPDPDNYYGLSEASNLDLQDTINRIWSEINRIVREHSDPVDVITGADVDDVIPYGDDILTIANQGAKVSRVEFRGDMKAAVDTVQKLTETFLSLVRVVILRGEAKDLQRVTNTSVRILFVDALAKNAQLQQSYGQALIKIAKLAVQMSNKSFKAKDLDIKLLWKHPLPVDQTEIANINALAIQAGYRSRRTASVELGDDWSLEEAAIEAEHTKALERQKQQMEMTSQFMDKETGKPAEESRPGTNPRASSDT